MTRIAVVGLGYVGTATALLLAQHPEVQVCGLDVDPERVDAIQHQQLPVADPTAPEFPKWSLVATTRPEDAYLSADAAVLCVPTDSSVTGELQTGILTRVAHEAVAHGVTLLVIKSTVPVGTARALAAELPSRVTVLSVPEFLREGSAYHDATHPERVVVGAANFYDPQIIRYLQWCDLTNHPRILITGTDEAEAIKLFSNAYLATRVAFFNDLDTFALHRGLDARALNLGVTLDPRIGQGYCNPSAGFGGYCLPKDTTQVATYLPRGPVAASLTANSHRAEAIATHLIHRALSGGGTAIIGIHLLGMKAGSDNWRESATLTLIDRLRSHGATVVIHEPALTDPEFALMGFSPNPPVHRVSSVDELENFPGLQVIYTNRAHLLESSAPTIEWVSRDLYGES